MIRQHEAAMTVLALQRAFVNLDFPLIAAGRSLVKMGHLTTVFTGDEEERAFLLFNDMLICAVIEGGGGWSRSMSMVSGISEIVSQRPSSLPHSSSSPAVASVDAQYRFHHRINLEDLTVVGSRGTAFEIRTSVNSYTVIAPDMDAKSSWLASIREAKNDLLAAHRSLRLEDEADARKPNSPERPLLGRRSSSSCSGELPSAVEALEALSLSSPRPMSISSDPARRCSTPSLRSSGLGSPGLLASPSGSDTSPLPIATDFTAPIWMPDHRTERCLRCQEPFSLFRRRHHCRLCGDVVCATCSPRVRSYCLSTPTCR